MDADNARIYRGASWRTIYRKKRPPCRTASGTSFSRIMRRARVAELVDAHDSKSCSARSGGSIPSTGTTQRSQMFAVVRKLRKDRDLADDIFPSVRQSVPLAGPIVGIFVGTNSTATKWYQHHGSYRRSYPHKQAARNVVQAYRQCGASSADYADGWQALAGCLPFCRQAENISARTLPLRHTCPSA